MRYNVTNNYNKEHYIIFDFETTGLNASENEIIEYAFLEYKNGVLVNSISELVKPKTEISELITTITGISNLDVMDKLPIEDHLDKIYNFIKGIDLMAHNVKFDLKFLYEILKHTDLIINATDSIELMRKKKYFPSYSIDNLKKYLNINSINHRAYEDCLLVKQILEMLEI